MTVEELVLQVATYDISGLLRFAESLLVFYVVAYTLMFLVVAYFVVKFIRR